MSKTKIKSTNKIIYAVVTAILVIASIPINSYAAPITTRKVVIGSSLASANTSYNFTFTAATGTIKSIKFQACDAASGACTQSGAASGFSAQTPGATLTGQPAGLGSGGSWTIDTTDATSLRILNNSNSGSPSADATVNFSNVHNPSASNSTFYIRITTYSDNAWTNALDTGVVATSTAGQITVTASVNETLTFTLATNTVALGILTSSSTASGTSTFSVATNASTGYAITYSGNTLTAGTDTITAMSSQAASATASKQFGINLMANTTPSVGANKSGAGTGGTVNAAYGTQNQFKFLPAGEEIANSATPTNSNTFTVSYIANIDDVTPAGQYSTAINYVATAKF
jgi:hypothetical protein